MIKEIEWDGTLRGERLMCNPLHGTKLIRREDTNMNRFNPIQQLVIVLIACILIILGVALFSYNSHGVQTEAITVGQVDTDAKQDITLYKQVVHTATAADEVACVDAREYDTICYFADTGGTGINVDIDRFWNDTTYDGTLTSGAVTEDITQAADGTVCEAVIAPYYCYDVDSSSSGTLSLTWYLVRRTGIDTGN